MRSIILLALTFSIVLLSGLSLVPSAGLAQSVLATPTSGYVTYKVTLSSRNNPGEDFLLNETSQPIGANGLALITFHLLGGGRDLDYSKVLNASSVPEVFPFLVGLNNQSFSYSIHNFKIEAHILRTGTTTISFNGASYQGMNYLVSASVTNSSDETTVYSLNGNIVAMPSGLLYSVKVEAVGQFSLAVQLLSTNLQLTSIEQSGSNIMFGYALVGMGLLGAVALAAPSVLAIVRVRMAKPKPSTPPSTVTPQQASANVKRDKPEYWVD